eukprot:1143214-Pelagomonas_calceolata.AAC.1
MPPPTAVQASCLHSIIMILFQSDAVFVRCIPGRPVRIDPLKIPPQDRDIHLMEFKFCPDTKLFPTLEAATAQTQTGTARWP